MHYWLMKSEPTAFSIDDLEKSPEQTTPWDGVRNYQARNMLRDSIKKGDQGFFYHSSCAVPGIVGKVEVVKEGYPDFTALDPQSHHVDPKSTSDHPRWFMVDIKLIKKFPRIITLQEIKQHKPLRHMIIARKGNRLSITPVTRGEWETILKLIDREQ